MWFQNQDAIINIESRWENQWSCCHENQTGAISSAYQLLTDGCRKQDYIHIYRFGGYDNKKEDDKYNPIPQPYKNNPANTSPEYYDTNKGKNKRKTKQSTGIGYGICVPLSYFFPS